MKYCTNCGTKMEDDAVFCENCGTKQEDTSQKNNDSEKQEYQQSFSAPPSSKPKKKGTFKYLTILMAIVLSVTIIVSAFRSCSSPDSLEDVASDFAEALLIDFNAKKAVSFMSEDLIDSYIDQMDFSSKRELIDKLDETFEIRKEDTIAYYGDDWKAEVIDVEIKKVEDDLAVVIVSVSHEGSDALWNTNIDELWVYLVDEDDEWRVYDFES